MAHWIAALALALGRGDFDSLVRDYERWYDQAYPEQAIARGRPTDGGSITDPSREGIESRHARARAFLDELRTFDPAGLTPEDRLDWHLLERELDRSVRAHGFRAWLMPVGQRWGPQQDLPQMAEHVPLRTEEDYANLLSRLEQVPQALAAAEALLREGMREGITPPRVVLQGVPAQFEAVERGRLQELERAFRGIPTTLGPDRREALLKRFGPARDAALESLSRLHRFVAEEYLPAARESIACSALPDGAAYYDFELERFTTTPLRASEIHAIGLREVAAIRREMLEVIRRTPWWQSLPEQAKARDDGVILADFISFLRTDPQFHMPSAEALLSGYRDICKRVDAELPAYFGRLPRLPYGVREIPRFMAPSQTTAYYQPGSMATGLPGWFYANTYALDQRPTYEMVALAMHEAVPGHHLQISLAEEMEGVRHFRRDIGATAFVEGWALYSESLGTPMGLYEDPYADFGRLLYRMWRACRLVVDTGIHASGWTKEQAVGLLMANTALSPLNIDREVDRYIGWPGQACAYMIGELRIRAIRAEAEAALGERFDIRAFHDALLGAGAIPLDVLEARMDEWIAAQAAKGAVTNPVPR